MINMMPSVETLVMGTTTARAIRRSSLGLEEAISGMSNSCDAVMSFRSNFSDSWDLLLGRIGLTDAALQAELLSRAEGLEPEPSREISEEAKRIFPLTMQIQMQCRLPFLSAPVKEAMRACKRLVGQRKAEVTEVDFMRELLSQKCLAAEAFDSCAPRVSVLEALESLLPAKRKPFNPYQNIRKVMDAVLPGHSDSVELPERFDWQPPEVEYKERPPEPDHVPSDLELAFNEALLQDLDAAKIVQQEFSDPVLRPDHIFLMFLRRADSKIRSHLVADGEDVGGWISDIEKSLIEVTPYPWKSEVHHEVGELLPVCRVLPDVVDWWKREDGTIAKPDDEDFAEVTVFNRSKEFDQPYDELLWLRRIVMHDESRFGQLYSQTSYHDAYFEALRKRFERPESI